MTEVIHVRDMKPGDVYVGRAVPRRGFKASPYGNPFKEGMDPFPAMRLIHEMDPPGSHCIKIAGPLTRENAVELYRLWVLAQPELMKRIERELKGKRLACWCHPQKCHAQVLADIAEYGMRQYVKL